RVSERVAFDANLHRLPPSMPGCGQRRHFPLTVSVIGLTEKLKHVFAVGPVHAGDNACLPRSAARCVAQQGVRSSVDRRTTRWMTVACTDCPPASTRLSPPCARPTNRVRKPDRGAATALTRGPGT